MTPSEQRLAKAHARDALVVAYRQCLASGLTREEAAAQLRRSRATLDRWMSAADKSGFEGLLPRTDRCGRKSTLDRLKAAVGEQAVDELLLKARATALDTGSAVMGFRLVAKADNAPEALAAVTDFTLAGTRRSSKHALPPSIRDSIRLDPVQQLAHRGRRALTLQGMWTPRRLDILPGDVWTSDDTTPIWGWWVPWPHAQGNDQFEKASCEYRFGVKLLQGQFLPLMDVASQCVFTFALIARETAGYRASDIWGLFGRAFALYGLPRLGFQLERGSWEANLIRGQAVEVQDGEVSFTRRVGGLRMLPTQVTDWHREKLGVDFAFPRTLETWTSYLPKSKSIEAAFDRMQTLEGTIWGCLGRDQMRRPNERAKKQYEACRRGSADPREHFLSGPELVKRLEAALTFLNDEPMEGEVFRGVPRLLWEQSLAQRPLLLLPPDQQHLYRRNWHATRIVSGWARARFTDAGEQRRTEYYTNPEVFASMEGRAVVVYFDAERCEDPAQIVDAATNEFLCEAQWFERPGMFLDPEVTGHQLRKRYNAAVTTLYGDLAARAPSRMLPAEIADRRGSSPGAPDQVEVQRGPRVAVAAPNLDRRQVTLSVPAEQDPLLRDFLADDPNSNLEDHERIEATHPG